LSQSNRLLLISFYPLLLAAKTGGVLVDQIYARKLQVQEPERYTGITSEVADALLLLTLPVLIAGALSLWVSDGRSRVLIIVSLLVFSLNFGLPVLASFTPGGMDSLEQAGPLLRIAVQLGALVPAVLAIREVVR
jgi:hypothetical protein